MGVENYEPLELEVLCIKVPRLDVGIQHHRLFPLLDSLSFSDSGQ